MLQKLKNLFKPINKNSDGYHTFDELYKHRHALFIALLNKYSQSTKNVHTYRKYWKSKVNSDGSVWDGWFIAGIEDKITYHLPMKYWRKLKVYQAKIGLWDGHTSKDVVERLLKLK